jgi:hybrid cluster-associated redox disulfide protein
MATPRPTDDMTVAQILELWPETVPVFQELNTACVGCVMAPFDTMADVARIYNLDLSTIIETLNQAVAQAR